MGKNAMTGRAYFYQQKHSTGCTGNGKCKETCGYQSLSQAMKEAIKSFQKKHGYLPRFALVREDEVDPTVKYPVEIKYFKSMPPSHFWLCPVVSREARIFEGKRKSYEKS